MRTYEEYRSLVERSLGYIPQPALEAFVAKAL